MKLEAPLKNSDIWLRKWMDFVISQKWKRHKHILKLNQVSEESEADARQALEAFDNDKDFQKQMDEWRKMSKSKKHSSKGEFT